MEQKDSQGLTNPEESDDSPVIARLPHDIIALSHRLAATFTPSCYELEVLARHYLFLKSHLDFLWKCGKTATAFEMRVNELATKRLDLIRESIGDNRFEVVVRPIADWWDRRKRRVVDHLGFYSRCDSCLATLTLNDVANIADGFCIKCRDQMKRRCNELLIGEHHTGSEKWRNLLENVARLEAELEAPATNWERGGDSAPETAVSYINGALHEFADRTDRIGDLQTFAVCRVLAVLRRLLIDEYPPIRCFAHESCPPVPTKSLPKESQGLEPLIGDKIAFGVVAGVNDVSALLVESFAPTEYELGILAAAYEDDIYEIEYTEVYLFQYGGSESRSKAFATRRIDTIWSILGEEKLTRAVANKRAEWESIFARKEAERNNLLPCPACQADRRQDYPMVYPDGHCAACSERCEDCEAERNRWR